ncbi:MAG: phosphotransferase [Caldilineaceae bacterium]
MLINGDIGPYHVLCDRDARLITGIIDFGTAGLGDPAVDLPCLLNSYGESFLRRMDRTYPLDVAGRTGTILCGNAGTPQWLLGGLRSDDKEVGSPSTLVAPGM